jgi:GT2 family glycosyltransferase
MKHVILILNFNNYMETVNYVNSIKKNSKVDTIVVVDNGSKIENYQQLVNHIEEIEKVKILRVEENLGFSAGNNYGYNYIKEKFIGDYFVHCTNSDIKLLTEDFYEKTEINFNETNFSIMGPSILTDGITTSPLEYVDPNTLVEKFGNMSVDKMYRTEVTYMLFDKLKLIKQVSKLNRAKNKMLKRANYIDTTGKIPILQGSYFVYSPNFNNKYDRCFPEVTFIYCEEYFLFYSMYRLGEKVVYNDKIVIDHFRGKSTTFKLKNRLQIIADGFKKVENLTNASDQEIKDYFIK